MSIEVKDIEEEGFAATIYTLKCGETGREMVNIIARCSDTANSPSHKIKAVWENGESGQYSIDGLLSYGPVEKEGYSTTIVDMETIEDGDDIYITVHVEENR
jgi:hypothetical protein